MSTWQCSPENFLLKNLTCQYLPGNIFTWQYLPDQIQSPWNVNLTVRLTMFRWQNLPGNNHLIILIKQCSPIFIRKYFLGNTLTTICTSNVYLAMFNWPFSTECFHPVMFTWKYWHGHLKFQHSKCFLEMFNWQCPTGSYHLVIITWKCSNVHLSAAIFLGSVHLDLFNW